METDIPTVSSENIQVISDENSGEQYIEDRFYEDRYDNHIIHWRDSQMVWAPLKFKEGVEFLVWGKIVELSKKNIFPNNHQIFPSLSGRILLCMRTVKQSMIFPNAAFFQNVFHFHFAFKGF